MTSSSQQVEDPRFAELIRPIKDLTANFNIPLSQFLDMYYSDLRDGISGLSSTPMDSQSKVNFAQAGLLIQGTVSVYSRKSVQDEMEMGDCPSNTEEVGGSSKRKNKLLKKDSLLFHGDFLPLPCNFSPHTLMKDSSLQNNHINFIAITPSQLFRKRSTNETLGPKDDFRVNSQYCSVTVSLDKELLVLPIYLISLFHYVSKKNNDDLPSSPPLLEEINEVHHFEGEFHSEEPDCIEPIEEDLPIMERKRRKTFFDTDMGTPLNPHEVSNQEKNVSKKRRTTLLSRRPKLAPEEKEAIANIPPELTREAFEEEKRQTDNSPDENDGDAAQDWNEGDAPDPHEHFPLLQTPSSPSLVNEIRGQILMKNLLLRGSLVNDVETEEISRYFLSCLMLANTSNLELESNGMNNLFLTLLTKKRHHEELMASQEEPVLTKSSSRKRVMLNPSNTTVSESIHQEIMDELNELPDQGLSQKEVFVIPRPVKLNKHVYQ
ncbi:unnamed protein product [Lepeophtheirus salmonis]|uniref:(salmon louse) hypothetical protein n=1 Tax=Lepeophtheirus salmonis TaxID=72036 RepID=A0A7R8CVQ1_LEPSM|nr:unnamed protein product [Lepeophtheirus salmonis]CAF2946653.1 unnamed protein product [Lepeophtheirus salmonis]